MQYDVRAMLDVVDKVHVEGEPITPEDLDLHELPNALEAVKVWRAAFRQKQLAEQVLKAAGIQLATLLGEGGAAVIGTTLVRYRKGVNEKCIDTEGFLGYVANEVAIGGVTLSAVFNPNYAKRTWMDKAVRETFFEKVIDPEPSLDVMPRDRGPAFLSYLQDGEVLVKQAPEELS